MLGKITFITDARGIISSGVAEFALVGDRVYLETFNSIKAEFNNKGAKPIAVKAVCEFSVVGKSYHVDIEIDKPVELIYGDAMNFAYDQVIIRVGD